MLHFFRKYQKFFFIFITIVIVVTFVFFGTNQTFTPVSKESGSEDVLFRALDGKGVKRSYLAHMSRFLEREDWMQSAKIFDSNYLNDGVISTDFLQGDLSRSLFDRFSDHFRDDLAARLEKERSYTPYHHPHMVALTAPNIWAMFAPEIPEKLAALQKSEDGVSSFNTRVELFLAERNFPPVFLTQVLRYQEREKSKMPSDPRLAKDVVSLFGYHDFKDWFGEKYVESVAAVVINSAAVARQKGYSVSREEILAELIEKSQKTYDEISANMALPVENGHELFQLYLRYKGLDQVTAIRIWEEITLFRRMMQEIGSAALVDSLPLEQFYAYATKSARVEICQMAPELRLKNEEEMKLFAAYLAAVSPLASLELPLELATVDDIEERAPQLVGKRYHLYVGSVKKEALQARVSVKETWDWELANWEKLREVFPELALREGSAFEILETMEKRGKIDAYARAQIVALHPEWVAEATQEAQMRETNLFLTRTQNQEPLPGITDTVAFQKLLDQEKEVNAYSQDQKNYYRIVVDERGEKREILPFQEAKGVLTPSASVPTIAFATYLEQYRDFLPETAPFKIEKREIAISRNNPIFVSLEEVLRHSGEGFSAVAVDEKEGPYCYRVKEVSVDNTIPMQKWIEAQELLAKEMRVQFFEQILSEICSKTSFP